MLLVKIKSITGYINIKINQLTIILIKKNIYILKAILKKQNIKYLYLLIRLSACLFSGSLFIYKD